MQQAEHLAKQISSKKTKNSSLFKIIIHLSKLDFEEAKRITTEMLINAEFFEFTSDVLPYLSNAAKALFNENPAQAKWLLKQAYETINEQEDVIFLDDYNPQKLDNGSKVEAFIELASTFSKIEYTRLCTIFGRRFQRDAIYSVMNFEGWVFFTLPEKFI